MVGKFYANLGGYFNSYFIMAWWVIFIEIYGLFYFNFYYGMVGIFFRKYNWLLLLELLDGRTYISDFRENF